MATFAISTRVGTKYKSSLGDRGPEEVARRSVAASSVVLLSRQVHDQSPAARRRGLDRQWQKDHFSGRLCLSCRAEHGLCMGWTF